MYLRHIDMRCRAEGESRLIFSQDDCSVPVDGVREGIASYPNRAVLFAPSVDGCEVVEVKSSGQKCPGLDLPHPVVVKFVKNGIILSQDTVNSGDIPASLSVNPVIESSTAFIAAVFLVRSSVEILSAFKARSHLLFFQK